MQINTIQRRPKGLFSILKLIKTSLEAQCPRETWRLALLSIDINERAQNLDFREVIEQFASAKATLKIFN